VLNVINPLNSEVTISKEDFGAGTYILRITDYNGAYSTKKIIFH
jgi:hypothetical protein